MYQMIIRGQGCFSRRAADGASLTRKTSILCAASASLLSSQLPLGDVLPCARRGRARWARRVQCAPSAPLRPRLPGGLNQHRCACTCCARNRSLRLHAFTVSPELCRQRIMRPARPSNLNASHRPSSCVQATQPPQAWRDSRRGRGQGADLRHAAHGRDARYAADESAGRPQ